MTNQEIKIGSVVELIPGFDEVYTFALSGSRAVVKDFKIDESGFPMVEVEWDKEHWRYNGEGDGWTFANHFRVIEEPKEQPVGELNNAPLLGLHALAGTPCPYCGGIHDEEDDRTEDYIDAIMSACDEASEADGFVLVALKKLDGVPGMVAFNPVILSAALTDDAMEAIKLLHERGIL